MHLLFKYINGISSAYFKVFSKENLFNNSLDLDSNSLRLRKFLGRPDLKVNYKGSIILVEANQIPANQLALSLVLPAMAAHFEAEPVAYRMGAASAFQSIKQKMRHKLSIMWISGIKRILIVRSSQELHGKTLIGAPLNLANYSICTKSDLEQFQFRGIHIGDLIYDQYLVTTHSSTVDFKDARLARIFFDAIHYLESWQEIFLEKSVSALCIWHDVYLDAIPARVALEFGVEVFTVTASGVHRLTRDWPHAAINPQIELVEFDSIKERFDSRISMSTENNIDIKGDVGKMFNTEGENYQRTNEGSRLRILIANHIFFDAPHCYGIAFYPDFEMWLTKLGEIALETNYVWYLKPHPHTLLWGKNDLLEEFASKHPQFKLLPVEFEDSELNALKIDFVLTVHGTTALHYSMKGYKVINASENNRYKQYNFSYTPENRDSYEKLVSNLENFNFKIDEGDILRYQLTSTELGIENWLFYSYSEYFSSFNPTNLAMSTDVYAYFLDSPNVRKLSEIRGALKRFLLSRDTFLNSSHFQ